MHIIFVLYNLDLSIIGIAVHQSEQDVPHVEYCGNHQEQLVKLVLNNDAQCTEVLKRFSPNVQHNIYQEHPKDGNEQDAPCHAAQYGDGKNPLIDGEIKIQDWFPKGRLRTDHHVIEGFAELIKI